MKRKNRSSIEEEIRRKVEKRFEDRNALIQHALSYAIVNVMIWVIWLATAQVFPWPLFVTGGWGIGLLSHVVDYYSKHGPGARKREAAIEAEVTRQLALAEARENRRRRRLSDEDETEDGDVYSLEDYELRGLRLSDDGELVDFPAAGDPSPPGPLSHKERGEAER